MNVPFLIAAILAIIATLAHGARTELSSQEFLRSVSRSTRRQQEIKAIGHLLTFALMWSAVILFIISLTDFVEHANTIARFIAVQFFGFAAIWILVVAADSVRSLVRLPHWILAWAIGALAWGGTLSS